ncbi:hypothetical protein H257_09170 [Aphanomyces astaci]|uniref:Uncharacterized protein n=1 Tax=Aphanomyces astaci TaxID=112090 RepID=W4GCN0_APHAT|nr:hypothetical protein H257_09170 [Aphanomyces astaci]ETV76693.1 hypothetical protein H257_09170 [Aphanomyces astaci]|eukprot:XP_009833605.1 hypothetical protein H257_09170 [Aphanomyces astaci]
MSRRTTSEDDLALLVQANHERTFLQDRVMKSWGVLACNLLKVPGFSCQELEVDGKKTSHRFHLILDNHEKFQKEYVYLYGLDRPMSASRSLQRRAGLAKRERL